MGNNSRFFFILLAVGAALGIGNIFIYAYLPFNFSVVFFIPYAVALILFGIPLLTLEFSSGQYFSKNIIDLFASIKKWFSGIGWLMVINSFILMSIYAVVLAWYIIYIFASFGLQWKDDVQGYFLNNVIQVSDGFRNFTQLSLPVLTGLIISWALIFAFIRKGHESMKRMFLATMPVFAALMILFLFYLLSVDNALTGIYSFLEVHWADLANVNLWLSAFSLAAISLGVSFGFMNIFARKSEKGFIVANSFVVIISELISSIIFGFILFSILGFLSGKGLIGIGTLAFSDYGSLFLTLTSALPYFYKPTLLSMLFFLFLAMFFLFGAASLAYSVAHILVNKFNAKHVHAAILVAGFGFLSGFLFIARPGILILDIIVHFIYYNILIALLLESFAIGWFKNPEKIAGFINQNSKLKIGEILLFMIKYFVPLILMVLLAFQLKSDLLLDYKSYPLWALLAFGVGVVAVPLVVAFLLPHKIFDRR